MADIEFSVAAFMAAARAAVEPVKQELFGIARRAADKQYGLLKSTYPVGPGSKQYGPGGQLRKDVYQGQRNEGSFWVTANAPHVHLYELGTKGKRSDPTRPNRKTGIPANRGQMPAARIFVGLAIKHRAEMYREGQAVLDRHHVIG